MNKLMRNMKGTTLGLTLALLVGTPAVADDTELLLMAPPDPSETKPTVMFILDTSGSMRTVQITAEPYDSARSYAAGTCDVGKLYYSDSGTRPVCDGSNIRVIDKASFHCNAAAIPIASVGSYTGVMVQYHFNTALAKEWLELEPGNSLDPVECQADSGTHGENLVVTGANYAASGSGLADPWTSDAAMEIDWSSSGHNVTYDVYDGNYLNYLQDQSSVDQSRMDIMKTVTKTVLGSVSDMNIGIMRFNDNQGGPVILAPVDLDTNRTTITNVINSLAPDGWTPLSETLFENALYWHGIDAYYGEIVNEHTTDSGAIASDPPMVYERPPMLTCSKNFNVLISDGEPTQDVETPGLLGRLPDYAPTLGRTGCTGTGDGACLDDVAEYLSLHDSNPTLPGRQSVITHTIGYSQDIPILEEAALASGGQYFRADDIESLTIALTEIVAQINERALSFSAPAVSVNTFNRTRNLNDVYLTMFGARGNAHWPGNVKAYRIQDGQIVDANGAQAVDPSTGFFYSTARSYWTVGQADGNDVLLGGAANRLPDPTARRLFTDNGFDGNLSSAANALSTGNVDAFTPADFGLDAASTTTVEEMIRWMRGEDIRDEDNDPATTVRYAMGDPLHSQPAAVVYGGTPTSPEAVIFAATNDGYLHAIDARTGVELWSYVPKELLPKMARLFEDPEMKYKLYGLDGDIVPVIRDVDRDGIIEAGDGDLVIILFGMRRGGNTYRALNVTDKNNPVLMWERTLDEAGQSWSAPVVTRLDVSGATQNALKAVAIVGGGYNLVHDTPAYNALPDTTGSGIHALDLMTGETIWRAGHSSTAADLQLSTMTRAIPTRISVVDINGDGFADRMYASDLGGQLWRLDVTNGNPAASLVAGGVIAQFGGEGQPGNVSTAENRRFYNSPDVAVFNDPRQNRRFIAINIGSGYRAHPLNIDAADRFYSLRDPYVFNSLTQAQYDALTPKTESDLVDITGRVDVTITEDDAGWMLRLPDSEMVLADAVTFNNEVFFVSFSPDLDGAMSCNVGQGVNHLYRVSILNGDPIMDDMGNIPTGGEDAARKKQLAQGGIAPTPQFLFPSPDDPDCTGSDCAPPPLGCIGVECFDPGFANNPVRTLWTQDGIE